MRAKRRQLKRQELPDSDERQKPSRDQIEVQSNHPFEELDSEMKFVCDDQSTLTLLEMNTEIHSFFYHRAEVQVIDAPISDLCELCPDEFESQPSTTKKPKSLDSTDNLEDNSSTAPMLGPFSSNSDPAH